MKGKKILLAISGGIAAYKCCNLVRLLVKEGASVQVILSPDATKFVSPLTLSVLSKNTVLSQFYNADDTWNNHVELALQNDLIVIAPATANTIGKMAHGICDNLLMATYFSAKCPIMFAPAMDLDMYAHPTIQENIRKLQKQGNILIPSGYGELASGLVGLGRMAEPEIIFDTIASYFTNQSTALQNKKVLVTAGPTYEAIDPVRFIGNHSSGKMGAAIAQSFAKSGAEVVLVCGPGVPQNTNHNNISRIDVMSAEDMLHVCKQHIGKTDILVMSAAVADYRPANKATQKIKKKDNELTLNLVKNPDILSYLGETKKEHQIFIGFALETRNEKSNAQEKLKRKNCDLIVLNSLNDKGAGFGTDTNKVTLFFKGKKSKELPLMSKQKLADELVQESVKLLSTRKVTKEKKR
ncbi:MAG: bifunctional phosphopantothenoylcysteine decarboxylase/phosphopantothenate--cysteine ligase CoaBC [Bacteroidia bacterium]|nr:bifunctional phosphopantothenoylcysteine decarboxylase/phosphopantothenate--cysteine ligase CoaBC [Bacteroidia bacterium]